VNQGNPRKAMKRQSPVSTLGAVFDNTNMSFDVRYEFIYGSSVQVGMPGLQSFKLMISKDCINKKTVIDKA
jgi:hypothetical protein